MTTQQRLESKLMQGFHLLHLQVENESHRHNVPPGSESHFKVVLVSDDFSGKSLVMRHQAVYGLLADELKSGIHALALHTYTPQEWRDRHGDAPLSPPCLGGGKPV